MSDAKFELVYVDSTLNRLPKPLKVIREQLPEVHFTFTKTQMFMTCMDIKENRERNRINTYWNKYCKNRR